MLKYISIRVVLFAITFFITLSFTYIVFEMANLKTWVPGYENNEYLQFAWDSYIPYLKNVLRDNDWGSYLNETTVLQNVLNEIPTTFKINLYAFMFYLPVGITIGIITAYYSGTWIDKIISYFTVVLGSIPEYVTIGVLMIVFAYSLGWFSPRFNPIDNDPWSFVMNYSIPILALSIGPILIITRTLRAELIEVKDSNFVLLARCKGLTKIQTLWKHSLRNSILPVISQIPIIFGTVLSVSFVIEIAYDMKGAAALLYNSIIVQNVDISYIQIAVPTATLIVGFYVLMVMVVAITADLSLSLFDPRIKLGSKK